MKSVLICACAVLLSAPLVESAEQDDGPMQTTTVEGITEYKLDNGLKVLLFPDPSKPQVTVNMTVFVGSRHEGYGEAGMAHLLEHMLFKGTPAHPNVPKVLQEHGANFNGTTWLDRTNYYETLPATDDNLEFAIRLEADRLINSHVRGSDLESEMTVVRNEFERGENSPSRILAQRMMSLAFDWHNYGQSTIGNRADIERVPIDSLKRFYRKYYQPDNTMVIVAGDFDPEKALGYIQKYFGEIARPERELEETYTEEPPQDGERSVTLRRVGDVAMVGALYHIPSGPHPDYVPLDALEHILSSSPSGRLYKALVETKRAASVSGAAFALHDPGVLRFMAEVAPGNSPDDVLTTMLEIIETVGEEGVTEEEVERARTYWLKEWELAFTNSSRLAIQLSEWAAQGDWRLMFLYRDRLEQVTPDDVQRAAAKYLERNNRTVGRYLPTEKPQRSTIPETPQLAGMIGDYHGREGIAAGEAFDVSVGNIAERTELIELPVGTKAALLPKKTRGGSVTLRLTLRYGRPDTLAEYATAAETLPRLMTRGTENLSRQELQDLLDRNRARLSVSGNPGEATFTVETQAKYLADVLDVLRQVLREPALPEDEFEVIRTQKLASLEQQLTDPFALARIAVSRRLSEYPPTDVRYVPTVEEEIERWKNVTLDEVKSLYNQFLGAEHGQLSIVGDFEAEEVQPLLDEMLADWTSQQSYEPITRAGDIETSDEVTKIETPDKANAVYLAGDVLEMSDADPDYPALVIGNYILGSSGLSSRLGDRVRQEEGLSYGVGSFMNASAINDRTVLSLYAITNPQNIGKVQDAINEVVANLVESGITDEELQAAKQGYLENRKVNWSNDSSLTSMLNENLYADRTMAYHKQMEERIRALTVDDVNSALKRRFDPEQIAVAIAGDFAAAAQQTPSEESADEAKSEE